MVVLNLTMQFIDPDRRQGLLERIYAGLEPGGILVLTEKFVADEEADNARMIKLYHAFKKAQGYSELEISQKRKALENVLVPEHQTQLRERLLQCGFGEVLECFRCFNFLSLLAIK